MKAFAMGRRLSYKDYIEKYLAKIAKEFSEQKFR